MTKAIILPPLLLLAACDSGPSITATLGTEAMVLATLEMLKRWRSGR